MHLAWVLVGAAFAAAGYALTDRVAALSLDRSPTLAQDANDGEAARVLGRPLPHLNWQPAGMSRSGLTIDPRPEPIPGFPELRFAHQYFSIGGENVAVFKVNRGRLGVIGDTGTLTVGGTQVPLMPAEVRILNGVTTTLTTRAIADGKQLLNYYWERDGLAHELHVLLTAGLTRDVADRMVASAR